MLAKVCKTYQYYSYLCPTCGCIWDVSYDEVVKVKSMICQGCDSHLQFERPDSINLVQKSITEKDILPINDEAVDALVALGFKRSNAKQFVRDHVELSTEDIIIEACKKDSKND